MLQIHFSIGIIEVCAATNVCFSIKPLINIVEKDVSLHLRVVVRTVKHTQSYEGA